MGTKNGVSATIVTITPEYARQLLEANESSQFKNRVLSPLRVARYSSDIKGGRWHLTGEAIAVGDSGQILNGQHRLTAVVDAGVGITTLLVTGVREETYQSMDQGMTRGFKDYLGHIGYPAKDAGTAAAALKMVYIYDSFGPNSLKSGSKLPVPFTNDVAAKFEKDHPDIGLSVPFGLLLRGKLIASVSVFCHYIFSRLDATMADDFMNRVADGIGVTVGDPAYTLRERLFKEAASKYSVRNKAAQTTLVIKAWNSVREGNKLTRIWIDPQGVFEVPEAI